MPSQALAELSEQIESRRTDSFGKFYMYATLLNKITVRDRTKTFADTMPFYTKKIGINSTALGLSSTTPVYTDNLDSNFNANVINYQSAFDVKVPDFILSIQRIALSFIRKGQLSDLAFIIDKMNEHLHADPISEQRYNGGICYDSSFESRKSGLIQVLESAQRVSKLAQDAVDNSVYALGTIVAALLSLKITMFLGGLLLTIATLAAAGYATYLFVSTALVSINRIQSAITVCNKVANSLSEQQANNVMTPDNLSFIINGVLKPIAFAHVTVLEQTATDMDDYRSAIHERDEVTNNFTMLNR